MSKKTARVIEPFSGKRGFPNFDYGAEVSATKQSGGLYTVTRYGHEASNANTVRDVPKEYLRFNAKVIPL